MPSSNVCGLLIISFHDLTWYASVRDSLRSRASSRPLLYSLTTFYSSANPLLHHRLTTNGQGRLHYCYPSPGVGGSMQSQEAKLASMNLKSPRLKSNMPGSTSARTFNTSTTSRQSLAFDSCLPSYPLIPPILSAARATPRRTLLNSTPSSRPPAAPPIAYPHRLSRLASSVGECSTWASVSPLGQVAERNNSLTQDISVDIRSSCTQTPTFHGQPCYPLSAPRWQSLPRLTIPHHGRWLCGHGEYASLAHVPETVVVCDEKQQQRHEPWADGRPCSHQIERPVRWLQRSAPRLSREVPTVL